MYEVMSHMRLGHVAHLNAPVSRMHESCHAHEKVVLPRSTSNFAHVNKSLYLTHMAQYESCNTYERVMSHACHASDWVMSII